MNKLLPLVPALFLILIFPFSVNAADINEEQTTEKYLGKSEEKAYKKVETVKEGQRYTTKLLAAAIQGYDNNVFLDPRRVQDTFSEAIVDAGVSYPLSGRWDVNGGISAHNITYWKATDANLTEADLNFGFNGKLPGNLTLTAFNDVELVEYQANADGNYLGDKVGLALKQKLPNNFFHSLRYEYFYKHYSDRRALDADGVKSAHKREDGRNTVYYDLGVYLKRSMFKVFGEYYYNNSNDNFLDYYDYESLRLGSSMIYLLTDKMSTSFSYYRQFRNYPGRTLLEDPTRGEKDRTWVTSASVFYDIYKNATLGLSYSYRQNLSNNPTQKYSGSITSLGLYCRF
ncbi:MAG: hypothetical protein PHR22_01170 [Candidatus Omnitrophica bacterium]|nr:hypothetical protein [Candidatus Omnitrophota bacterium]